MAFQLFLHKNMQIIAATGALCLYTGCVYTHLWGLDKYIDVVEMRKDGKPVQLNQDFTNMCQEVFDKILFKPVIEANIKFFVVYGQDLVNKGSTSSKNGAVVGVPINYTYKAVTNIEKDKITLNNASVPWDSPDGIALLQSLILSEKAQKFSIARELMSVNHQMVHSRGFLMASCGALSYFAGFSFNRMYNLHTRVKVPVRLFMYYVFANLGFLVYLMCSEKFNWLREQKTDRKAADIGVEYAEGGVEFYDKLLARNMAMRALLGEKGPKQFTAFGNQQHFWRSPHIPLTARRDIVKQQLKQLNESKDNKTEQTTL